MLFKGNNKFALPNSHQFFISTNCNQVAGITFYVMNHTKEIDKLGFDLINNEKYHTHGLQ